MRLLYASANADVDVVEERERIRRERGAAVAKVAGLQETYMHDETRWHGIQSIDPHVHGNSAEGHDPMRQQSQRMEPLTPLVTWGQVVGYDAASATATVQAPDTPTRLLGPLPVSAGLPRDGTIVGLTCVVLSLDAHNPNDGAIVAAWLRPMRGHGHALQRACD